MNADRDMRDALATLLTQSRPFEVSGTDLLRAGRARRRRRTALTAAAAAVLLAIPTTAVAITANHHTAPADPHPDPNEPRLVLPQPCRDGTDERAGLSAAQVSDIKRQVKAVVKELVGQSAGELPVFPPGPDNTDIVLHCAARERILTLRLARLLVLPRLLTDVSLTLVVGADPVGHAVSVPETTDDGVRYHSSLSTPRVGGYYYVDAQYGPYFSLEYSVSTGPDAPRPFQSAAQLRAFLHDPRILEIARLLAG